MEKILGTMSDDIMTKIMDIGRNDIRIHVRQRIITSRPEILSQMDNKLITEATFYIKGYADALREHIVEPYIGSEIKTFMYDRAYDYIVEQIDNK